VGVPHLFTTRRGGAAGDFDLGGPLDDGREERLGLLLGRRAPVMRLAQVHGATVVDVGDDPWPDPPPAGDALVTWRADRLLMVRTADCVPVLLARADGRAVAAVHAGWRGLLAGVLPAAVAALGEGAAIAAVGPCLSPGRFEVGEEVAAGFVQAGLGEAVLAPDGTTGRPRVDLRRAAWLQLQRAGVTEVDLCDRCTWEHGDEFFSYRRDVTHGGRPSTGSLGAVVTPREAGSR
jgi:YfiH family protein